MKRLDLLSIPLLLIGLTAVAQPQVVPEGVLRAHTAGSEPKATDVASRYSSNQPIVEFMIASQIWYSDFEDSTHWTFQNQDNYGWAIVDNNQQTGWFLNNLSSSSGGKRAEMDNGDPSTSPPESAPREHIMVTTSPIDVSTITGNCVLEYQQRTWRFRDEYHVEVSNDGSNWLEIGNNDHLLSATDFNSTTGSLSNPEYMAYYIPASVVGFGNNNLWIRFRWSDLDDSGLSYGWIIDDVTVYQGGASDFELTQSYFMGQTDSSSYYKYTQVPTTQGENANFRPAGIILNQGNVNQTDVLLVASEAASAYLSTSSPIDLDPGEESFEEVPDLYQPSTLGSHTLRYDVSNGSQQLINVNRLSTWDFEVTENTWAYDDGDPQGAAWYGTSGYSMCVYFDNFVADTVRAIEVFFPQLTGNNGDFGLTNGTSIGAFIYDEAATSVLGSNAFFSVDQGDAGAIVDDWVSIPLEVPLTAEQEGFYACFRTYEDQIPVGVEWDVPRGLALVDPTSTDDWLIPVTESALEYTVVPMVRVRTTDPFACDDVDIIVDGVVSDTFANAAFTNSIDITISGNGLEPYTVEWTGPGSFDVVNEEDIEGISTDGTYVVVVTDLDGCKGSASFDIMVNGVDERLANRDFELYPNPAHGNASLVLHRAGDYEVDLLSVEGEVISSMNINGDAESIIELPIETLASGVYFVRLNDGATQAVQRLVIR